MTIRLLTGLKSHFDARFWEWLLTIMLAWAGIAVSNASNQFLYSAAFDVMRDIARQDVWGALFLSIAIVRALALFLNGTFSRFRRFSPLVRSVTAGFSGFAWAFIALGLWQGAEFYIGAGTYFGLMVGDFYLLSKIAEEAGEVEREYRDERA